MLHGYILIICLAKGRYINLRLKKKLSIPKVGAGKTCFESFQFCFSSTGTQTLLQEACIGIFKFLHVHDYINACMFKKNSLGGFLVNQKITYILSLVRVLFLDSYHLNLSVTLDSDNKISDIFYFVKRYKSWRYFSPHKAFLIMANSPQSPKLLRTWRKIQNFPQIHLPFPVSPCTMHTADSHWIGTSLSLKVS